MSDLTDDVVTLLQLLDVSLLHQAGPELDAQREDQVRGVQHKVILLHAQLDNNSIIRLQIGLLNRT